MNGENCEDDSLVGMLNFSVNEAAAGTNPCAFGDLSLFYCLYRSKLSLLERLMLPAKLLLRFVGFETLVSWWTYSPLVYACSSSLELLLERESRFIPCPLAISDVILLSMMTLGLLFFSTDLCLGLFGNSSPETFLIRIC